MIKLIVCSIGFALAAWRWHWVDGLHLMGGGGLLAALACAWWSMRRFWNRGSDELPGADVGAEFEESIPRRFLVESAKGLILSGLFVSLLTWAWFPMLERVPALNPDRDRSILEQRLAEVERAGNFSKAAELIRVRLSGRCSREWRAFLVQRLFDELTRAAEQSVDLAEQRSLLNEARELARSHDLDGRLVDERNAQLNELTERIRYTEDLRRLGRWSELVTTLRSVLERKNIPAKQRRELAAQLCDAVVASALECGDVKSQIALLRACLADAEAYGVPDGSVRLLLGYAETRMHPLAELDDRVAKLTAGNRWAELITAIEEARKTISRSDWNRAWDRLVVDAYLRRGDQMTEPRAKIAIYELAARVASEHQVDSEPAVSRRETAKTRLNQALAEEELGFRLKGDFQGLIALHKKRMVQSVGNEIVNPLLKRIDDTYGECGSKVADLELQREIYAVALRDAE